MALEAEARKHIDEQLSKAGWAVQDWRAVNPYAGRGVAVREFRLKPGHGTADYLLYIDQRVAGAVEAKRTGVPLIGVEPQSDEYAAGLPDDLPAWARPLPFVYQSTDVETRFTNGLDPEPRSRPVFCFHRPETLAQWLNVSGAGTAPTPGIPQAAERGAYLAPATLLAGLRSMPPLNDKKLWAAQAQAVRNLEESLRAGKPRALVQMATGSGKTYMACSLVYRLIKHAGARRVLFLVDRSNLGRQTLKEFQGYDTPDDGRKFTELYNVQHLQSNKIDNVSRVCIATIQRVYSMLRGEELDPALEEMSGFDAAALKTSPPPPVEYNPDFPIETFDVIITDECHRSIYNLWRQVLEYFDASLIGLTATPSKQTLGFFNQNLVMEYNHERAVADGVNVDFDVYRIRTEITEQGSRVEAGYEVERRDRQTRKKRWEELDEDLEYTPNQLDRDVVAPDQIRTVIQTYRDKVLTDIFPGRAEVPKTLIFAKDDSHAEEIVEIVRQEFGKGNDFAQKITYKTVGKPEDLIAQFRNSANPRIAVTVDMIATGTDVKPLEVVFFMRNVRSRNFFEQMKGRGARVIPETEFLAVTPDAGAARKTRFVIVDAVGVTESELMDTYTLDRQPTVSLDRLLDVVSKGNRDPDVLSTLASRLARLDRQLTDEDRAALRKAAGGATISDLAGAMVRAVDPDSAFAAARSATGQADPPASAVEKARRDLLEQAARPIASNPGLRQKLIDIKKSHEQTIDAISKDRVIAAGYSADATEKARGLVTSFKQFIEDNKDEITALQMLYSRPARRPLAFQEVRELAEALRAPPRSWTPDRLWEAYEQLDRSKVRGSGGRVLTDIVSLVRYAIGEAPELEPFADHVRKRFEGWMAMQDVAGRTFTPEQRQWLEAIRDHIAGSASVGLEDFSLAPFTQKGGLAKAYTVFGDQLQPLLETLNKELVA